MRLSLRPLMTFALIGTAAAVPAFAQSNANDAAPESQYAACAAKPTQADTDAAHGAYVAGKGSFDEADYARAINYFKDAYRRDCTKNELLVIIARAYELQGNRREAVHALETYLERVPAAQDAEVQKRHIANLKREIAEQPAASASASASVAPSASASTSPPASASAAPSASVPEPAASSAPTSTSSPDKGHTVVPWIVVAAGGVALITGGVLYGVGSGQVSNAEGVCGTNHMCPANAQGASAISSGNAGRSNETVGVAVGGAGLAVAAAGLIWHFLEPTGPAQKSGRPTVTPQVGPGYAGVGVGGRF
ncbi:MAG: tetratricopeptide repeat protein [Polyangiaceae bacterium]|jgi:hypothetical protein